MTKTEDRTVGAAAKEILLSSPDGLREVIRAVMQETLGRRANGRRDGSAIPPAIMAAR